MVSCHHFKYAGHGQNYITDIIKKTPRHKLIKCLSAFNGFAIYKTSKFTDCWYNGHFRLDYIPIKLIKENNKFAGRIILDNSYQNEDCEHRFFHFSAVKKHNARIRISPLCLFV